MNVLRTAARATADLLGRDSALIRAFRPAYEAVLDLLHGHRGMPQTLNGRERFRVDPRHRHVFPEVYDPAVMAYLRARVRPGAVCLNVGAHVGIYALCLAEWAGTRGRVIAFEPNPETRRVLERHIALNAFGDRIIVEAAAIGDTSGIVTFIAAGEEGTSRLGAPGPATPGGHPISVPATTVDGYCADRHLTPDWITLDIEGWEMAALTGARATILARRAHLGLIVEMHPNAWADSGWSAARAEALFAELGLIPVPLTGQRDALREYGIVALEPATGGEAA